MPIKMNVECRHNHEIMTGRNMINRILPNGQNTFFIKFMAQSGKSYKQIRPHSDPWEAIFEK